MIIQSNKARKNIEYARRWLSLAVKDFALFKKLFLSIKGLINQFDALILPWRCSLCKVKVSYLSKLTANARLCSNKVEILRYDGDRAYSDYPSFVISSHNILLSAVR